MKTKKILALAGAACMSAALFAGCGNNNATPDASTPPSNDSTSESASLSGSVSTGGSTSMEKLMSYLQETYMASNPEVNVTYDPTGSGSGVEGAQNGSLDIGLSSRGLHDDETGVAAITVCLDGIAMVTNTANPVEDLTIDQLASIFSGETTNWSEVGGNDGEIVVIGREAGSGTRDGFESIVGVEDVCAYVQELTATGAVIAAVASNENAIGYASLSAVDDSVNMIKVNGVVCSTETVQDGSYAIQRPFNFIVNGSTALSDTAQSFIDFATGPDATDLIIQAGCIPVA